MINRDALLKELTASREITRRVADDLDGARELGPLLATVNPPRWELGHVGWFQEYWCLRRKSPGRYSAERTASILPNADALYNSASVPHDRRWSMTLPAFADTLRYRDEILARLCERLSRGGDEDDEYFVRLAVRHEDMHAEAFHYTRQTLAYPAPALARRKHPGGAATAPGDVALPGGTMALGAGAGERFVFDNEKWAHPVVIAPFRMSRTPVSNAEFLRFVEAEGYRKREFWSNEGWQWCRQSKRFAPAYWRFAEGRWHLRRFDHWIEIPHDEPVLHVNWYEADAYCRFAGRRLPGEAEWEYAALWDPAAGKKRRFPWGDEPWTAERANLQDGAPARVHDYPSGDSAFGLRQMIGNVWEWTASIFLPYPGYLRDPYKEYSEPWFATHRVLRGGSFATPPRVARGTFRNFYTPDRADVFAGFRTCAPDA